MEDKYVQGLILTSTDFKETLIRVLFTSDDLGETLSLSSHGIQFTVPYEQIQKIARKARKQHDKT